MGILRIAIGDTVPVILLLSDGETGMYPQAEIYNDEGTYLTTLDLSHDSNGVYVPSSVYVMPDEEFIRIVYIVYTDVGHTTESLLYLRDIDIFYLTNPDDYKADISALALEATSQEIKERTDRIPDSPAPENEYDIRIDDLQTDITLIKQVEQGRWKIVSNQMIFYDDDNVTPLLTFDLKSKNGTPTMKNVFERTPV